jgi:hypothetical protein
MTFAYGAGGLTLVADRGLHGLPPAASSVADIRVHVDARPSWTPPNTSYYSSPSLEVTRATEGYAFTFVDGASFWIDRTGETIWMMFATTIEDACTYLAGPVLSFAFRLRGEFSLHASAIVAGNRAVAFAGSHAAGKSTTAAALGRRGYAVLTDDILRVTPYGSGWQAHSFGSVLRLWPDGETIVFGTSGRLGRLSPYWDKRALAIGADGVAAAPASLPLAGIAFLGTDERSHGIALAPLSPADALIRLAQNSSAAHLLDAAGRHREFTQIAAIAAAVPCVEVTRPADQTTSASIDEWLVTLEGWIRTLAAGDGAPE